MKNQQKPLSSFICESLNIFFIAGLPKGHKTPGGKNEAEAFFSTDINLKPTQIIRYFVLRWNIEVTFEETRAHLGV